ncbi:MAG: UDP-N-acetylglucosamine 2-epimerase [Desulfatiglandaceae bacterium]
MRPSVLKRLRRAWFGWLGTNKQLIISEAEKLLNDKNYYQSMARGVSPYGDGKAAQRITSILKKC